MFKKVVVLGIDGLEPKIVSPLLKAKKLPFLTQLPYYSKLQTTVPPQSPVAWASFVTGLNPQKHGLIDFVQRDPKNYRLYLPYSVGAPKKALRAPAFWESVGDLSSKALFLPTTFPASKLSGEMITGMGTPDLLGTEGKLQLFTSRKTKKELKRGILKEVKKKKLIKTSITGPQFKKGTKIETSQIPLKIFVKDNVLELEVQGQKVSLKTGRFSPWIRLNFRVGWLKSVWGIAKFFLASIEQEINLYLSPLNIDPQKPYYSICFPKDYSQKLVAKYGPFATLGLPHDTWAMEEGIFDTKAFLRQADDLLAERKKIILAELADFNQGLFVAYLGTIDPIQHMFWGQRKIIDLYYQKIDEIVGQIMGLLNDEDLLLVLSDHGFGPFDWEFHLNAWLKNRGYLCLEKGNIGKKLLGNIDWRRTKAYGLGFNSLYFNLVGREKEGIVSQREKKVLIEAISEKLKSLKNPVDNKPIVKNVYAGNEPDLIIGYHSGFRASWETAVGATPKKVFKKRVEKWKGDHLFDASEVPGVLFASKKLPLKNPSITQVMPFALKEFGIKFPHQ